MPVPAKNPRGKPLLRLAVVTAAIGLFLVGYYWGNQYKHQDTAPPAIAGVMVHPPIVLPPFELQEATGKVFTAESMKGRWTLLSFADPSQASGHLAVSRMIEVRNRLAIDPDLQNMLQLVLVAQQKDLILARDFGRLSPAFKLLSGAPEQTELLRSIVGAPAPGTTGTLLEEVPFYLIGPASRLLVLFPSAQAPASIATDLSIISEYCDLLYSVYD